MHLDEICFFVTLYQIFVSTAIVFENDEVPNNTFESVFQFLLRHDCIKCGKIERFDSDWLVESWRFKMF